MLGLPSPILSDSHKGFTSRIRDDFIGLFTSDDLLTPVFIFCTPVRFHVIIKNALSSRLSLPSSIAIMFLKSLVYLYKYIFIELYINAI